jgi:hypothetical protein
MTRFFFLPLFFIVISFTSIEAWEVQARLESVLSNSDQIFYLRNRDSFYLCQPYGVITLEDIYRNSKENSVCRDVLEKFYMQHADKKYFTLNHLKLQQYYMVNIYKDGRCIIHSDGMVSLSQKLLQKGLAMIQPNFHNKEYEYLFQKAQNNAIMGKKGLWNSTINHDCKAQYYKVGFKN